MKVLQVSKFYPPVMGGIESVAWELTEGLNRAGLRTDVLCSNQGLGTAHGRADSGYDVVRAGSLGMALSTSMAHAMLYQLQRMAAAWFTRTLRMRSSVRVIVQSPGRGP